MAHRLRVSAAPRRGGGGVNHFGALAELERDFEMAPGVLAGAPRAAARPLSASASSSSAASSGPDWRLAPSSSSSLSSSSAAQPAAQWGAAAGFAGLADALPPAPPPLSAAASSAAAAAASSWSFAALAAGLSQTEASIAAARAASAAAAAAEAAAAAAAAAQPPQAAGALAVHGRERDEFRAKVLAGRGDLSAAARRRKALQLRSGEGYADRRAARIGGGKGQGKLPGAAGAGARVAGGAGAGKSSLLRKSAAFGRKKAAGKKARALVNGMGLSGRR